MSFILDALDKAEEEKKGTVADPVARIEGGREFNDSRRFAWMLTSFAVAAMALSLAAFVWVQWQRERAQRLAESTRAPVAASAGASLPIDEAGRATPVRDDNPFRFAAAGPEASAPAPRASRPSSSRSVPAERAVIQPTQPDDAPPVLAEDGPDPQALPEVEETTLPAMRLIGRNANTEMEAGAVDVEQPAAMGVPAAADSLPASGASSPNQASGGATATEAESDAGTVAPIDSRPVENSSRGEVPSVGASGPADPPTGEFSLQGTSVIDGRPVAVINDIRVFVGDWIGGARVIEITDREVRLDVDGTIVTLAL